MTCKRLGGSLLTGIATIGTEHSMRLPLLTYTLLQSGALQLFAYAFMYDAEQTTYFKMMRHDLYAHT